MQKYHFLCLLTVIILVQSQGVSAYGLQGSFLDMNEQQVPFTNFEGKLLLIEAFATWCSHCQDEHEELYKLWEKYNDSLQILSLSVASDDTLTTVRDYLLDYPSNWDVGLDIDDNFKNTYGISGFPALLFFGNQGEVLSCHLGERSFEDLSSDVENIMADTDAYMKEHDTSCELDPYVQFLQSPLFIILVFLGLTLIILLIRKKLSN